MRRSGLHLRVGHKAAARTRAATLRALLERANPLAACVPRATLSAASALAGRSWAAMAHDGRCIYRLANADAQRQGQEAREHASQQGRSKHAPQQRREPEQRRACSTRLVGKRQHTWLWPAVLVTTAPLAVIRELRESTSSAHHRACPTQAAPCKRSMQTHAGGGAPRTLLVARNCCL